MIYNKYADIYVPKANIPLCYSFVVYCLSCIVWTHLSRNRRAAGVRHGAALWAGVFLRAVEVKVPGPVGVVVPSTALKLSQAQSKGVYLETVWCRAGRLRGENPGSQLEPGCADGAGISPEESHGAAGNACLASHVENPHWGQHKHKQSWQCGAVRCVCVKPQHLFLDVIHQILQIQVIPVVNDRFLYKLPQSISGLWEKERKKI